MHTSKSFIKHDDPLVACSICGNHIKLVRWIANNGLSHIRAWCDDCSKWHTWRSGGQNLPKETVKIWGIRIDELPPMYGEKSGSCSVRGCQNTDVEKHHIMPRHLHNLYEDWPTILLCRKHHKEWHEFLTPDMYKKLPY